MNRNPSLPDSDDPDRFLRCQESMDDAFAGVAASAVLAGWHPEEVAAALVELADNHMLSVLANRDLARDLADLKK
jgi:hypothetical protein